MRTGFAILAHERLDRAAALAGHLAAAGAAVVVHVDARVPAAARAALEGLGGRVRVIATRRAEWGMIGLVEAALDAVRALEAIAPDLRHVCLLSGACLPVRPVAELEAFLADRPATDFIETVPVASAPWVQGGLSAERFTLYFPVGWKRRRRLFDALVDVQRALGVRRRMPAGLEPRLGLQWWCLSAPTLRRLLAEPRLKGWLRYFRRCWIPDESFFQTLVPLLAEGAADGIVDGRPLTLQRFDAEGRPVVFHDDHLALLEGADFFFARKIDPDAGALYARFLRAGGAPARKPAGEVQFEGVVDEAPFEAARLRAREEGRGVPCAARLPERTGAVRVETVRPYAVLVGDDPAVLERLREALVGRVPVFHGRLFRNRPAAFAVPGDYYAGKLPGAPRLRDYRPSQFLARLLWADRGRDAAFLFMAADNRLIAGQILGDPNARLVLCGDGARLLDALVGATALPVTRRAWARAVDPADTAGVGAALACDWWDPCGWEVPNGAAPKGTPEERR